MPDLRPVSAGVVPLKTGPAYLYTFARSETGTVQGIAIVPRPGSTYTIDSVAPGDAPHVAAEVGEILRSFSAA